MNQKFRNKYIFKLWEIRMKHSESHKIIEFVHHFQVFHYFYVEWVVVILSRTFSKLQSFYLFTIINSKIPKKQKCVNNVPSKLFDVLLPKKDNVFHCIFHQWIIARCFALPWMNEFQSLLLEWRKKRKNRTFRFFFVRSLLSVFGSRNAKLLCLLNTV